MVTKRALQRQEEVLAALAQFIETNGYSPSIRELADANDMWVSATAKVLAELRDLGKVTWTEGQARTLRVT